MIEHMAIYKALLLIPAAGLLLMLIVLGMYRSKGRTEADAPTYTRDPALLKLQADNPNLRIAEEHARLPIYWILALGTKRGILLPKSEAEGATIRTAQCDATDIPEHLLYPRRLEMACIEIDNPTHKLSAYFFRTDDKRQKVADFFEQSRGSHRRFSGVSDWEERYEMHKRPCGIKDFVFYYFLREHATFESSVLVGYREERKPDAPAL
jgi:hypothetical protein